MVAYSSLTLRDILNQSRILYSERPSLAFVGEKPLSYCELSILVNNTSCLLSTIGIEKGDRVALLGENSPNWGIAYLAITCMGAVVVPILPDFSAVEVKRILDHSQAKAIFISAKQLPKLELVDKRSMPDTLLLNNLDVVIPTEAQIDGSIGYSQPEAVLNIDFCNIDIPEPMEEDLAAIIYTSGTTGRPKGVMLTHKNLISNALSTFQIQDIKSSDRLVSLLPLSHTYECTIGFIMPIMRGASVYYLQKPPTPPVLIPALQKIKPTMMLVVPLIIEKVFRSKILPQLTSSKVRARLYKIPLFRKVLHKVAAKKLHKTFGGELHFFGIGGAKLSYDVEQFLYEGGFPYSIGYGMTEAAPLLSGCTPSLVKFRCAGFSLPGQEMKVMNPNPSTGEGEVWVRGANVMGGYYKDEELTHEVLTEDGWLKTGDLGVIHSNGFLELRGRLKNMIVGPSGENIYPEDIEEVINSHSLVLESLVYEISGKLEAKVLLNYEALEAKYSNIKEAAITMQQNMQGRASVIMNEIKQYVNSKVASFAKLSIVVEQVEPFEKTPTHKIKRYIYTNK
ncbi:MAG: AMP-binding protein [Tenuifilaceae bacterium]|nr:AMP-binding protein [Tenuifilaceae bacterium]